MTAMMQRRIDLADPFDVIAGRAAAADAGEVDLKADMDLLHQSGILGRLTTHDLRGPLGRVDILRQLGRASLSVGRLAEGHMNALELLTLYGTRGQLERYMASAREGHFFGVWGADGPDPVRIDHRDKDRIRLSGGKQFCSGLGILRWAIVTVETDLGPQLVLADVADASRGDLSGWDVSGMRATASGRYDLTGLAAEPLGQPGDYLREPYFEGGVWRYAALHVGGLEAVADCVRKEHGGPQPGPAALHRLGRIALLARSARLLAEDAAKTASTATCGRSAEAAAALSLLARQGVEDACVEALQLADRTLGARSFVHGHPLERLRRDLGFFLRQADLDGKLERAAGWLRGAPGSMGTVWD